MSTHCQCPRCSDPVTLPDGYAGDATVRCPHCEAEYSLDEAMQNAPPMLIIVNPGSTVPVEPEVNVPLMADSEAAGLDKLPETDAGVDIGMPWSPDGAADDGVPDIVRAEDGTPAIGRGMGDPATDDTGFGDFSPSVSSSVSSTPTASAKKKKKSNPISQAIQVLFGLVMAVVIVYYILNLIPSKREEWDKNIYLPFLSHTHDSEHFGYSWFWSEDANQDDETPGETETPATGQGDPNPTIVEDGFDDPSSPTDPTDATIDDGTDLDAGLDDGTPEMLDPADLPDDIDDGDDFDLSGEGLDLPTIDPVPTIDEPVAAISYLNPPLAFTSAEVGEALKAVDEGYGCANCKSRGFTRTQDSEEQCPVCEGAPNLAVDKNVLTLFKNLAEALAFAQGDVKDRRIATEKKFSLLSEQGMMETIGTSAAFQLFNADGGKTEGGILFQGEVTKVTTDGDQQIISVLIEGFRSGSPAVVITAPGVKSSVSEGDTIGVLGYAVKDPKSKLSEYSGDEDMVVWAGCIAPLY